MTDPGRIIATPGITVRLKNYDTTYSGNFSTPKEASKMLRRDVRRTAKLRTGFMPPAAIPS